MLVDTTIAEQSERKQFLWFGHVNRISNSGWPQRVLTGISTEKEEGPDLTGDKELGTQCLPEI